MDWNKLLIGKVEEAYRCADGLMALVEDDNLDWRPATGENWWTTGQLLHHITQACGATCRGFVTGDWGLPEGVDANDMSAEEMLPPAEAMATIASVAAARAALAEDKELAIEMIVQARERMEDPVPAPWDPRPTPLGQQLLGMINHLDNHKGQLFYYLKLQGKPVNTMHLYGMA